ncbi:hypothetical protein PC9H_008178 [Pleurotus ostreatus]|uniref:Fungal-type protein kinase domain-containing protein n=1 Tax=Pleurotus ostreatus TaxID=5322 RepID=A0A8H7DQV7_PLEOS|nr:uncharacterized protein PC9H_008178 [Pleurotus ostreatus]KAF7428941.1 hypothetical protein PC9H_008178 [Pleurotus ostreatus]
MPEQNKYTPRRWRHSLCSTYITSKLATQRQLVVQDHPEIPVVSLEFFRTVTPAVPDTMRDAVLAKLKEDGSITSTGRMFGFAKNDPKNSGRPENHTFTHIHNFTKAIIRAGEDHTRQKSCMTLGHSPNSTPSSERENSSRPDGFGRSAMAQNVDEVAETNLAQHDDEVTETEFPKPLPSWSGIILAKEDKKAEKESDALDNFAKVMWSGHHILRNDPRRNFCFGITTENATCRLWFFARSHIMVSEPFNVITDHTPLVRFILSLSFAHVLSTKASRSSLTGQASLPTVDSSSAISATSGVSPLSAQSSQSTIHGKVSADASNPYTSIDYDFAWEAHGYDPTIQRQAHSVYRIRVGDTWYITAGILSDSRAECICGRCTRVWRVYEDKKYEEGEEKVYYALKDLWVDSSNDTEAAIWRRLKEKVNPDVFDRHFLTLVAAFEPGEGATTCSFFGRGGYSHAKNVDFMDSQFIDILDLEPSPLIPNKGTEPVCEDRFHIRGAPDMEPRDKRAKKRPRYHPRTHDRSIWKEVCETYHDHDDMQVMFTMLEHAVKALDAMWEGAHAIHRDISTGNILFDGANGRLGDLEYVVLCDDEPSSLHNVKTGTLQFMAVEVSFGAYLFRPRAAAEDVFLSPTGVLPSRGTKPVHPFRHNVLHDLESIWWLAMWSIFRYYPENVRLEVQALKNQRRTYEALFSPTFTLDKERNNALVNEEPRFLLSIVPPFHNMGELALRLRNMLTVSYTIAEATLPIKSDCQVFRPAFDTTAVLLRHMKMSLERDGIAGVTSVYELLYPQKRKAEETGDVQEEAPPMKK